MPVLMTGSQTTWTEVGYGQSGRTDCPVCRNRDIEAERSRGMNRTCLRCLTATWDAVQWVHPPGPKRPAINKPTTTPTKPAKQGRKARRKAVAR